MNGVEVGSRELASLKPPDSELLQIANHLYGGSEGRRRLEVRTNAAKVSPPTALRACIDHTYG